MLFKYIREQTVVYAVVIAYYWKIYVNSAVLACLDHAVDHVFGSRSGLLIMKTGTFYVHVAG